MASLDSQPLGPSKTVFASSYPRHVTVERQQFTPIDRHVGTNRCVLPWAFLYSTTLHPQPLQAALAETLNQFPSLAGRVQPIAARSRRCWQPAATRAANPALKSDWKLLLCNAGVPFSICSSSWSLQDVISSNCMTSRSGFVFPDNSNKSQLPSYMESMDPVKVLAGDAPLLKIRLTQLAGGGSILALTASHIVLDGRSYVAFLQHWANLYNKLVSPESTSTADTNDTASSAAAVEGPGDSNNFGLSKKLLNDIALGTHTSTTVSPPRTAVDPQSAVSQYRSAEVLNPSTMQTALHGAAASHSVSPVADGIRPKPAGGIVQSVLQPMVGPFGTTSVHDSYESVTASKVTHLTRAASQQPSSTTAEAPDDASLQLSISISSTASTVMSTWSAGGKDTGHAVSASPRVHTARQHLDGDIHGATGLTPVLSEESLEAAVAVNSTAAVTPAVPAAGDESVGQENNKNANHQKQQKLEQSVAGTPSVKPFAYTPDPLYATRVPAPGWLPAMRSIRAALKQIKSEETHVHRALLEGIMPAAATAAAIAGGACKARGGAKAPAQNMSDLSTRLLHIPAAAVQRLKATASSSCSEGQYISSNDAVSALVWVLMCYLRRRPLPGQPRTTDMQDSLFGVALDLRTAHTSAPSHPDTTSKSLHHHQQQPAAAIPLNYFGNAAWSVSVRSCNKDGLPGDDSRTTLPVGWHKRINPREWQVVCSDESLLSASLAAGAMRIRGALQAVRENTTFTMKQLQQIEEGIAAPVSSQVSYAARFVKAIDGFTTSWQFGLWNVAFGSQGAVMFQGLVHPVPPYHAVIMPASPVPPTAAAAAAGQDGDLHSGLPPDLPCLSDDEVALSACVTLTGAGNGSIETADNTDVVATGQEAAGAGANGGNAAVESSSGGVWLWLTVPSCLVPAMAESPVLKVLLPDASWQSLCV